MEQGAQKQTLTYIYRHATLGKGAKTIRWGKDGLFNKHAGKMESPHVKE